MNNIITVVRQRLPLEQIALVEPFDPNANPDFKPHKEFKSRVVLLNRDVVLSEMTLDEFVEAHRFGRLREDNLVSNPAVSFRVETFTASKDFAPSRPFKTRLLWRDGTGGVNSRLLVSDPDVVIAAVVRVETTRVQMRTVRRAPRKSTAPASLCRHAGAVVDLCTLRSSHRRRTGPSRAGVVF
jgi:hypothetical protein